MRVEMEIIFRYNFQKFIINWINHGLQVQTFLRYAFLFFLLLTFCLPDLWAQEGKKSLLPLTIKGKTIKVEVARTEREQEKGLMFRERLGKDEGMLFVYGEEETLSFWMKNTRIPLSIAFIDKKGKIVDIQDMEPFSLQTHASSSPAKYALETNQGWFKRNGIHVGDSVNLPPGLKK
jgi:uncharacterized membrane protein (UPF0127 family)